MAIMGHQRDRAVGNDRIQVFEYDDCVPGFALRGHPAFNRLVARVAYSRTLAPLRRELGPVYGSQWRSWPAVGEDGSTVHIDQLASP